MGWRWRIEAYKLDGWGYIPRMNTVMDLYELRIMRTRRLAWHCTLVGKMGGILGTLPATDQRFFLYSKNVYSK
jgi:hypothetical protein